jgi:hypothetical protein
MSGRTRSRNRSAAGSRARSEFRFHVATRNRLGAGPGGESDGRNASAASRRSSLAARSLPPPNPAPPHHPRTRLRCSPSSRGNQHPLGLADPIVTRAGTIRRPERSHQLDPTGPTGQGSLRIQDTYRIDPNDLRSLPAGVAWIVTGGRAAKVAVARGGRAPLAGSPRRISQGGRAPLAGSPQRDRGETEIVGPGDPALPPHRAGSAGTPALGRSGDTHGEPALPAVEEENPSTGAGPGEEKAPTEGKPLDPARSPYAQGL